MMSAVLASLSARSMPSGSGMTRAVDPQKSLQPKTHGCVPVSAAHPRLTFCSTLIQSVTIMACVIRRSLREANHCIACVTSLSFMIRLEVVTPQHHCLCVQSFHLVWLWIPNQTDPLWLSCLWKSRCHVACPWLRRVFVFCIGFYPSWSFVAVLAEVLWQHSLVIGLRKLN